MGLLLLLFAPRLAWQRGGTVGYLAMTLGHGVRMVRDVTAGLCAIVATVSPCVAQSARSTPERVTWPLIDFVVFGDSTHGVQLLASPNLESQQGREDAGDLAVTIEPVAARQWTIGVAALVDSVARLPRE